METEQNESIEASDSKIADEERFAILESRVLAASTALREGYDVHVGCGAEIYCGHCQSCGQNVPAEHVVTVNAAARILKTLAPKLIAEITSLARWTHLAFAPNYVHTVQALVGVVLAFFVLTAAAKKLACIYLVDPLLERGARAKR